MSLFKKIQGDMYTAMKAGKKDSTKTLRTTLAKLKDKQIEKKDELSDRRWPKV